MRHISELSSILRSQFSFDKRKRYCLAQVIMAMISCRTVNLTLLADMLYGEAVSLSKYRRLQRLFSQWSMPIDGLGAWLLSWFYDADEPISLTMDRTNWQWGKAKINFLVVGVVYKRMAIPLMWTLLPKKGNSHCQERIAIMNRVLQYVEKGRINNLLCDREFVGKAWFQWLQQEGIPFKIRIKHNYLTETSTGQETTIAALFHGLALGQKRVIRGQRTVTGCKVFLTGSRLPSGDLMVIASPDQAGCAIELYCERWEIETLFENVKSRGFDLECTHITHPDRLHALLATVSLAACWAYRVGEWRIDQEQLIKIKKHGRPAKSLFRHGLDQIRCQLIQRVRWRAIKPLIDLWRLLVPPKPPITP